MKALIEGVIEYSARSVRGLSMAAPARVMMERELADAEAAQARGYFLPDEDERVRALFARYLSVRVSLLEAVDAMQPVYQELGLKDELDDGEWETCLRAFLVGFTAAAMLVRMSTYMVDLAVKKPVVWNKLDEAEARYGIPRKSFTGVYKNLSSTRRMWMFHEGILFCEMHRQDLEALSADPVVGGVVEVLKQEEPFLQYKKRDYLKRKLDYSLFSFSRRHVSGFRQVMFHMLKLSGSTIAELRQPFIKGPGQGKRVSCAVMERVRPLMHAGDIVVTRHDDAMSNLFLPGFWPHAALYIGGLDERDALGVESDAAQGARGEGVCFIEAKKDGVLFRTMEETLHVDAFQVLRPKLANGQIAEALGRAMSHAGKLYDFSFDFCMADRLACTELVYRGYHSVGSVQFELNRHSGRSCISAEDLIEQAISSGDFEKVLDFGVEDDVVRVF